MTRLLALAAALLAALLVGPLTVALVYATLAPTALAPLLAGADDTASPEPPETSDTTLPHTPTGGSRPPGTAATVLAWADAHVGQPYRMGATGPNAWDCSSFTQAAYAQVGVRLPRTAQQQRDWLAAGRGTPVIPGREQPADLIFWDSYLGRTVIGHVVLVDDPSRHRTVEAHNTRAGTGHFTYQPDHHRYEIWRPHASTSGRP